MPRTCPYAGCGWRPIAPTPEAAREQFAAHVVDEHGREVDASLPEGAVQVRHDEDDEWTTLDAGAVDGHDH